MTRVLKWADATRHAHIQIETEYTDDGIPIRWHLSAIRLDRNGDAVGRPFHCRIMIAPLDHYDTVPHCTCRSLACRKPGSRYRTRPCHCWGPDRIREYADRILKTFKPLPRKAHT